ncbi:MAG: hypothetical protein PHG53_09515 [Phycisphaerae bacterium]|nr:hypothetical protein [Phycisphaerae bacterium]
MPDETNVETEKEIKTEVVVKEEKKTSGFSRISRYKCNTCNCAFESTAEPEDVKCPDKYCPTNGWKEPEPVVVTASAVEVQKKPAKSWATSRKNK